MVMVRLTVGFKMKQTSQMKSAVNVLQNGYLWNHSFEVNYGAFMRELCGRAKKKCIASMRVSSIIVGLFISDDSL